MRQLKITQQITNRTPSVERYFAEVERQPLITPAQEIELTKQIKLGDKSSEDKLILANLRFVISVAKKYARSEIPLDDLINEGNLGLIKAAKKFDETRGFKFISYAVWWIRQSILESYPTYIRSIRVPLNVQQVHDKIRKWSNEFEQKNERQPSVTEICEQFDMETANYNKMLSHFGGEYSIDSKTSEDDDCTHADLLQSDSIEVYDNIEMDNKKQLVNRMLSSCLSSMEKQIICMFFGIGIERKEGLSLDEIGQHFCLTGERIRQIKEKALRKLKSSKICKKISTEI